MKINRLIQCIVVLLSAALLFAGCGPHINIQTETTEDTLTPVDDNLIVVGVSQIGSESMWRTLNTSSIQNVFTKENGYFLIFDNARQKQENQIKAIRSFISQQVDYIVFSPITEEGWDTVLMEAKEAGIPVILFDRQLKVSDRSLYTTWVGSNFEEEGRNAGLWLAEYLEKIDRSDENIRIVVLQGTEGASSVIGRTEGFDGVAAEHENWEILEQADAEYTTAKGKEVMKKMLGKYEQIDVVVSQNDDMAFGAMEALREVGLSTGVDGDVILLSFDGVKSALQLVEDGQINVDIECNPNQGEAIEQVIRAMEAGEEVEPEYYVSEQIFTPENVSEYLQDRTY